MQYEPDIENCLKVLRNGGIILYPTDTIWGIGCDATNTRAIDRIYSLKKRAESKSMIVLLADERDIVQYVAAPDPELFDWLNKVLQPTTVIFDGALGLPDNLVSDDGSIGIRLVRDNFCRHLIKRLGKPIVSTSANFSGKPSPRFFDEIEAGIRSGVDYVVQYRQEDKDPARPSSIVKWNGPGDVQIIRP